MHPNKLIPIIFSSPLTNFSPGKPFSAFPAPFGPMGGHHSCHWPAACMIMALWWAMAVGHNKIDWRIRIRKEDKHHQQAAVL